jgi:DNA polymerase lambda
MIGLKYCYEFLERIPRDEVTQIENVVCKENRRLFDIFSNVEQVKEAAESIRPGLLIQTCGSYRRGNATCGDCDILISHRDGVSHEHLLFPLVDKLKVQGFLIDDLVYTDKHDEEPG